MFLRSTVGRHNLHRTHSRKGMGQGRGDASCRHRRIVLRRGRRVLPRDIGARAGVSLPIPLARARATPSSPPACVCALWACRSRTGRGVGWRTRTVLPSRAGGGPTSPPARDGVSLPLPPARARSPSLFPPDRAGASARAASACSRCRSVRAHRPAVSSARVASFSTRTFGCIRPRSAAWSASCASAASTTSPSAAAASQTDLPRRPGGASRGAWRSSAALPRGRLRSPFLGGRPRTRVDAAPLLRHGDAGAVRVRCHADGLAPLPPARGAHARQPEDHRYFFVRLVERNRHHHVGRNRTT